MKVLEIYRADKLKVAESAMLLLFAASLPFSVSLIQASILVFTAIAIFRCHKAGTLGNLPGELKATPLFLPWLLYLGAGVLAALFGVAPMRSFASLNSDLLTATVFFSLCLFLKPRDMEAALWVYIAAISVAAFWGIFQAMNGLAHGLVGVRAHAAAHPVRFGEIMTIGLALTISRISAPEEISPLLKKLLYAAILTIIAAITLSQTRGAYLGATLVFLMLLATRRPPRHVIIPLLISGALLGATLSMINPIIRQKAVSIFTGANSAISSSHPPPDSSVNTRIELWRLGYRIIKDHPVLGVGPANVKKVFLSYCPGPLPGGGVWGSLHNLYIHQTAERGFVGLAALLTLFTSMLIVSLRNFKRNKSQLTLWALAIMPSWFLMNVTEITFQHVHTSYAVLFALAISIARANHPVPGHNTGTAQARRYL